jgi:predicted O-methyltransferase YrrM
VNYQKLQIEFEEVLAGKRDHLFKDVISTIHCMSRPRVYAVLNAIVSCMDAGELYLEVGCFQGGSLISALLNNETRAIGVDNFAEFQGTNSIERTTENLAKFGISNRVEFCNADYKDFFAKLADDFKIQTYFYDGAHAYEPQLDGMEIAWKHLQSGSIIIVDDFLYPEVNRAINQFIANHIDKVKVLLIVDSMNDCDPVWWNGVCVLRVL